jgi:hypothetical protein
MRESKSHFDDIVGTHWQQRDNTDCISSIAGGNIVLTKRILYSAFLHPHLDPWLSAGLDPISHGYWIPSSIPDTTGVSGQIMAVSLIIPLFFFSQTRGLGNASHNFDPENNSLETRCN